MYPLCPLNTISLTLSLNKNDWLLDSCNLVLTFIDGIILLYLLYFDSHIGPGGKHTVKHQNWKCPVLAKAIKFQTAEKHCCIFWRKNCVFLQKMQINARGIQAVENVNTNIFQKCWTASSTYFLERADF